MLFNMKSLLTFAAIAALCFSATAQQKQDKAAFQPAENEFYKQIKSELDGYNEPEPPARKKFAASLDNYVLPQSLEEFKTVWCNDPISQGRTGTCWCFSTSSFFESEVFRITKKEVKLSELYTVYYQYIEKARGYVQSRGAAFFGEGSEANAVAAMMELYGAVPATAYTGMKDGQPFHDHAAMFNEMEAYLKHCKTNNFWNEDVILGNISSIMDHYMGAPPAEVSVNGKTLSPKQYLSDELQLKPTEYVNFMSLKEAPYWGQAEYDVPDNWWNSDDYYNVPLQDFMSGLKEALNKGYSISLGGDVSESGYLSNMDAAIVPSYDIPSEYINEDARQLRFSNGSTTDDHAIHLVGMTENKSGTWFLIKDSGSGSRNGKFPGYYFYHEDYVKLKMMNFTVHKDAVKGLLKQVN